MMNRLATLPLTTWISWAAVLIVLAIMIIALKKQKRFRPELRKTEVRYIVLWCTATATLITVIGAFSWREDAAVKLRESVTINQAIEADPNLSRMATTAEALSWMDEEVNPLILDLDRANGQLEWAERNRKAAIAEIEKINAKLEEKEHEFERRFGSIEPDK